ncbi:MAG: site-2 protease family protein [Patescibacteria group bacterium]|nr:site-2 protease family protein [Patescibacteria group bacterium]
MQFIDPIFLIVVIVFSAIIHEVMHGVAADKLGDPTARYAGRLTLNPLPHIDLFGSILLPALFVLSGSSFFFGWAKPVPYNPYNLRPGRFSEAIVAGAGPASNLVIAILGGLVIRLGFAGSASDIVFLIVVVNIMLCVINLIPVPPLDGSKVLAPLLPRVLSRGYEAWRTRMEANPFLGMGIILMLILLFGSAFGAFIYSIAFAIAGM